MTRINNSKEEIIYIYIKFNTRVAKQFLRNTITSHNTFGIIPTSMYSNFNTVTIQDIPRRISAGDVI